MSRSVRRLARSAILTALALPGACGLSSFPAACLRPHRNGLYSADRSGAESAG